MRITKTYNWMRRDFCATMQCESCGHTQENTSCYDDRNYYDNIIPDIKCDKCGKSTIEIGASPQLVATKYPSTLEI